MTLRGVRHHLGGHEHDGGQDDATQFLARGQVGQFEHREIAVELERGLADKEAPIGAGRRERRHRNAEVGRIDIIHGAQMLGDVIDRSLVAMRLPDGVDRGIDQSALGVVQLVDEPRHLADDGFEHRHAVELVILLGRDPVGVDHREGVEAEP